jgi:hypothetical protein
VRPYEIIVAPYEVWVAPSGTAFPLLDAAPAVAWELLGVNGTRSYDEDGVTVTHGQTVNQIRGAGATGTIKAARTEEEMVLGVNLMDLTLEAYSVALNQATVTDVPPGAGTSGYRSIGLSRGLIVAEFAVLVRGASAYDEDLPAQYEVPRAYEGGSPAPQFTKGGAAILGVEFHVMEDLEAATPEERFGRLLMADAPATP